MQEWWSPQEIARRLRIEFPDDPMMRVSHETIYQSLFVKAAVNSAESCTDAYAAGERNVERMTVRTRAG